MGIHKIYKQQFINTDLQTLWDFIATPANLNKITPPDMKFNILTENLPEKMYAGMIICYKVSPFAGIKMGWVTEITQVKDLQYFVDEQRMGPYSIWHHEHILEQKEGGVLMTDIVHYKIPLGFIGDIVNAIFIKNKLQNIFAFRFKKMDELFPV